ncbi:DUF411 domain-containing protein [Novispirillum sp. DQ9]|uniref:DUF411 domain-containing protein n=1 Tax=Novispirillum sp. DQ9 TaxID=3398612 RepID=UPI003C7C7FBD
MLKTASLVLAAAITLAAPALADTAKPEITVYKSASCGCCGGWIDHMRANGYTVHAKNVEAMDMVKQMMGVPAAMESCHTATVDGYVVEGHVPADAVDRLLADRPDAAGLAVPGMPIGSPGMEQGGRSEPYAAMLFDRQGAAKTFMEYGK